MRRPALFLSLVAAIWAASTDSSRAEFRICNSSDEDVKIAFGNNDTRFGWTSRGWWTLAPGACQGVLYGDVERGNYYVYAIDRSRRTLRIPEAQAGGTFCAKDTAFDLRSNNFMTPQNTIACEAHGLKSMRFLAVEVTASVADFSYTLPAANAAAATAAAPPPSVAVTQTVPTVVSTVAPIIKEVTQTLVRPGPAPAPPPVSTPAPAPAPVAQAPAPPAQAQRPQGASSTACQRYPNLC